MKSTTTSTTKTTSGALSLAWRSSSVQWVRECHPWAVSAELAKSPAPEALLSILKELNFGIKEYRAGSHPTAKTLEEAHGAMVKVWDGALHQQLQREFKSRDDWDEPPLEVEDFKPPEVVESRPSKKAEVEESLEDVLRFAAPEAGSW